MLFGAKKPQPFFAAWRDAETDGPMTVSIDAEQIESPAHAGIMIADWMRHLARALAQSGKAESEDAALDQMIPLLQAELENPTDEIEGSIEN